MTPSIEKRMLELPAGTNGTPATLATKLEDRSWTVIERGKARLQLSVSPRQIRWAAKKMPEYFEFDGDKIKKVK